MECWVKLLKSASNILVILMEKVLNTIINITVVFYFGVIIGGKFWCRCAQMQYISSSCVFQRKENGWDKFPLCPQEASLQTSRSGSDQRNHQTGQLAGHLSGSVYCWSGTAQTCWHMQVGLTKKQPFFFFYCFRQCLTNHISLWRYWHRSLNPRKLIEVKFSHLSRNMTMQRTMKLYRLPEVGENAHIYSKSKKEAIFCQHALFSSPDQSPAGPEDFRSATDDQEGCASGASPPPWIPEPV